jgi:hypothetical protein
VKRTESTSSPRVLKKSQPEEFDLVILGGGTGSTIAACAKVASYFRRSKEFGITHDGFAIDMAV